MEGRACVPDSDQATGVAGIDGIDCFIMERDLCVDERDVKVRFPPPSVLNGMGRSLLNYVTVFIVSDRRNHQSI